MNMVLGKDRAKSFADRRSVGLRCARCTLPVLLWALIAGCGGCGDSSNSTFVGDPGQTAVSGQSPSALLDIAFDNLNRQEEFPGLSFATHLAPDGTPGDRRNAIPLSGEMLQQIVDQLNQWVRAQQPRDDWKPDPLVAGLPAPLDELPSLRSLGQLQFPRSDGIALQEAVWLRNVSSWARGRQLDDLSRAGQLFDWTVRNIQLETISEPEPNRRIWQMPWETLFLGRGTWVERAWVFMLLARQQGLDAALLVLPDPVDPAGRPPRPWAVGILSRGNVYLFDPALGLPLPAPGGIRLDGAGPLDVRPATLAQLAADDSLLRRLDLDPQRPYPVSSSDLDRVVALMEASPAYLARRMKLVESPLHGGRRVVLSTSATAQIERWKAAARITDAGLWMLPYVAVAEHQNATEEQTRQRMAQLLPFYATYAASGWNAQPAQPAAEKTDPSYVPRRDPSGKGATDAPLRKARILHIKGQFTGPQGATKFYQETRPSDERLDGLAEHYYQLALESLPQLPKEQEQAARKQREDVTAKRARAEEPLLRRAKQDASYWLGLVSFDLGLTEQRRENSAAALKHYEVAIYYFLTRTLEASPEGPWTHGANYNLARCYEATRQYGQAVAYYALDTTSPAYFGNLLRARWLNELRPENEVEPPENEEQESGKPD